MVRGDVHALRLPGRRGHAQHGARYGVLVQADDLLGLSTAAICPTSRSTPPATFHPEIEIEGEKTRVMCEMIGAVDTRTLGDQVAHLSWDELQAVDEALRLVLDLR